MNRPDERFNSIYTGTHDNAFHMTRSRLHTKETINEFYFNLLFTCLLTFNFGLY